MPVTGEKRVDPPGWQSTWVLPALMVVFMPAQKPLGLHGSSVYLRLEYGNLGIGFADLEARVFNSAICPQVSGVS
jgi:hypothetical protein